MKSRKFYHENLLIGSNIQNHENLEPYGIKYSFKAKQAKLIVWLTIVHRVKTKK